METGHESAILAVANRIPAGPAAAASAPAVGHELAPVGGVAV